jgi:uncharacterized membrane protein YkvA (DUF1232 family)
MRLVKTLTKAKAAWLAVVPHMRDSRVPVGLKAGTAVMGLLIISPLDIFSDIPVLGLLDDAVLLTLLSMGFVALARSIVERRVTETGTQQHPTSSALATK